MITTWTHRRLKGHQRLLFFGAPDKSGFMPAPQTPRAPLQVSGARNHVAALARISSVPWPKRW